MAMLLSMAPISAFAASVVASGKFGASGSNLIWSLDSDGVLTISGSGAMEDFASVSKVPWYSKRTNVKTVVIESGVTNIGKDAFYGISTLANATISDTVTSIGNRAFSGSGLTNFEFSDAGNLKTIGNSAFNSTQIKNMVIPDGVTTLGSYVFGYGPIKSVTIPASVTSIGNYFFEETSGLNEVIFLGNKEPETIGDTVFLACSSLAYVSVPADYEGDTFSNMKVSKAAASVAEVNGQGFATLADAISAAQSISGAELKLLSHISIDSGITIESGNFTIDLNGKELFSNGYFLLRIDGADVTIVDSAGGGIFNATNDQGNIVLEVLSGSATISGGTFNSAGYPATVRGGTLKLTGKDFVLNGNWRIGWYGGSIDLSACTADEVRIQACADGLQASAVTLPDGWGLFETDGTPCTDFVKNDIYVAKAGFKVTASVNPAEGGTVEGAGTYSSGATVTLTATAANGYRFINWIENGEEVSTSAVYTFTASKNRELTANFEIVPHTHSFIYTAGGSRIVATCVAGDCPLENGIGGMLTISAPADLYVDGTAKEATIENNLVDTSVAVDITYSTADGNAPKTAGTYTASVTVGGATATVEFTLLNYAAMVTDKDGNELSGSPYKTLADAITAAQGSEDSTLTLLDDVTLTEEQYIRSGKFTLDLNGNNLVNETDRVLYIFDEADLTIKDSGEGGTVQTNGEGYLAILSYGTLTVEGGFFKGDEGIRNIGTLTFNNGKIEADNYSAISNSGTAYIHNGILESSSNDAIINNPDATIYVYGGEFSGSSGIVNHGTAFIEGGEFTGKSYAALNLLGGTVEVTGGSFTGTDNAYGSFTGTPYGEWTVCYYGEDATLTLKGGEFPGGFVAYNATANAFLAEGYAFYDKDGNKITVADDAKIIDGYVQVKEHFVASVTDKDGNELSGSPYKTFADAITAAQDSEGSTVTLLDDVTLTEEQDISSGKFTLDLNGKTLLNETAAAICIESDADVTIKDSGEGGTIESKADTWNAVYNYGTLTVESGIIKGEGGISNSRSGTLNFKSGKIETDTYYAIGNYGTAYIYNGSFKSVSSAAIENRSDSTVYVYGGEFSGSAGGIVNHSTAYIEGGEFTGNSYAALNLLGGTLEVTGGSFTGTDYEYGDYSGTPFGEWTVCYTEGATLTLKGGEFPNGFVVDETTANALLAEGYAFYDKDGNKISVADDAKIIDGYVQVKEHFVASVTDKDGNEIGTYNILADAITAAQGSEGSTLTLIDDCNVSNYVKITSGTFTFDLAGNSLIISGSNTAFFVDGSDVNLTIADSIGGGNIYASSMSLNIVAAQCVTINNGIFDGYLSLRNGSLIINGGTFNNGSEGGYSISDDDDTTVVIYGGEFPNGFYLPRTDFLNDFIAEGCYFRDADGKIITVADNISEIRGYVKIEKGADLADAVITLDETQFTYSGMEHKPTVIVTVGGKAITEGKDYTLTFANNVNAGTATVTVTGAGDYKGEAKKEFTILKADNTVTAAPTPNTLTYNSEAHNLISAGEASFGTMVYSLDGAEYSETIPQGTDAGDYTVYYKVIGDSNHNDTEPATVIVTINAKDISDGFIILGAPLIYNGKEQTQTVEKVIPTGTVPEATYTVSGNKATNVGVYLLTVTGTGNFTGEAKIAFEIAVDMNGLDFEKTYPSNVKSTDRERIEYVLNQVENAETDLADAEKRTEWLRIKGECVELLKMIESVANHIESFKNKLAEYDIDTVTSDDSDDLESFYNDEVSYLYDNYFDNLTEEQTKELDDILSGISALQKRISDVAKGITRITNAVNGYDEATVKSSDKADLEQLKSDIKALTDGNNLTDEERADLDELDATLDTLLKKIADTKAEIDRVNEIVNAYDEDTVKSTDRETIEQLKEDIQALIDSGNVTEEEIEALKDTKVAADTLTDKITETENQLEEIKEIENGFNPETVTSDDKADIQKTIDEIEAVNPDNLTDEQREEYEEIKAGFEALLDKIEAAEKNVADIGAELEMFDEKRVTKFWEDDIEALKAKIDELLADENMGEAEKTKLEEYKAECDNLIEIINTPKAYFSMRLFYFVWDALHWLSSYIEFIFNQIF